MFSSHRFDLNVGHLPRELNDKPHPLEFSSHRFNLNVGHLRRKLNDKHLPVCSNRNDPVP